MIINPSYPDPGIDASFIPPTNKYLIGDFNLQRNLRYSAGIDQVVNPRLRFNVLYNYIHQQQQARGNDLNAAVNGVRPDPNFANVIEIVTDTQIRRHELFANATLNLAAQTPGVQQAPFNWRRLTINASYSFIGAQNNSGGPWVVPPTGNIEDDWGPGPADSPYRVQLMVTSTQVRNLQVTGTYLTYAGFPYTWTTGFDDNRDGFLNDRPAGVGLRTLRGDGQQTTNLRVAYTFNIGRSATGEPAQAEPVPRAAVHGGQQPRELPEPRRVQRRLDVAVLPAADASDQLAQAGFRVQRELLAPGLGTRSSGLGLRARRHEEEASHESTKTRQGHENTKAEEEINTDGYRIPTLCAGRGSNSSHRTSATQSG